MKFLYQFAISFRFFTPPLPFHRQDGKDGLKFYTDPFYFFELWFQEVEKDVVENMKKQRNKKKVSETPECCAFNCSFCSAHLLTIKPDFDNCNPTQEKWDFSQGNIQLKEIVPVSFFSTLRSVFWRRFFAWVFRMLLILLIVSAPRTLLPWISARFLCAGWNY